MAGARTIANLWRDSLDAGHPDPAYLQEVDGEWREVPRGEAAAAVVRARERTARARRAEGRRVRDPRAHDPRVGVLRLRARPRRRGRRADLRVVVGARRAVRARPLRGCRRASSRTTEQRAKLGDFAGHVLSFAEPPRSPRAGTRVRGGQPGRARRTGRLDRRGRPLHVHLHVRHDRPAEGVHDPPPQLLRDGAEGRRDGRPPDRAGRPLPPLPPPRAQLRSPAAPVGRVQRLRDRVPRRPAARRRPSCCASGRRSFRACPASTRRSTPRSPPVSPRRPDRDAHSSTGRSASATASRRSDRRSARCPRRSPSAPPRRPARLREGEGAARRPAARCELGRRTARPRHRRVLRRDRHHHPRGLRPLRGDDRGDRQPRRRLQVRHRRQAAAGRRAADRATTARS